MQTGELWGGRLESFAFDVLSHNVVLGISVASVDGISTHELSFFHATELRFVNSIQLPWTFAEFSEFHYDIDGESEDFSFDVVLWSDRAGLSGRCAFAALDGVRIER